MIFRIIIALLLFPSVCYSFNDSQKFILDVAYQQGMMINYPETIQAIAVTETNLGVNGRIGDVNKPIGKKSYGVCQIKLSTAKFVLEDILEINPFKYDEQIIVMLMTNDTFNVHLSMLYFEWLMKRFHGNWRKSVLAYNYGLGNVRKTGLSVDPNHYVDKIVNAIKQQIRPYNAKYHSHH